MNKTFNFNMLDFCFVIIYNPDDEVLMTESRCLNHYTCMNVQLSSVFVYV